MLEEWIRQGRITVNGEPAELGMRVTEVDHIRIDGRTVRVEAPAGGVRPRTIVYHKPAGEVTTRSDPQGRPTVFDHLPSPGHGRWVSIGRLDLNTAGLLLLTTDGELAHRLLHPSRAVEREYAVRVLGEVGVEIIGQLQRGVRLEDGPARFCSIRDVGGTGANHWYHVVLTEGRNREVRRLWESQGVRVSRLIRVRFGPILLPRRLRPGHSQALSDEETRALYRAAGLEQPRVARPTRSRQRPSSGPKRRGRR
jgi:23S rRNA pseudouridine2605 synthase